MKSRNWLALVAIVPIVLMSGCELLGFGPIGGTAILQVLQGTTPINSGGSYDFGNVVVGTQSSPVSFTIKNTGTASASLTGPSVLSISGSKSADFTITTQPSLTIAAGASTTFFLVFSPSAASTESVQISLASDIGTYSFTLTGTGIIAVLRVLQGTTVIPSGGSYDFSAVVQGMQSAPVTFTIENTGSAPATLSGVGPLVISGTNAGDYSISAQPEISIAAGASTTFTIGFSPLTPAAETAEAAFTSNVGTYTIALNGTGTTSGVLQMYFNGDGFMSLANGGIAWMPNLFGSGTSTMTFRIMNTDPIQLLALVGSTPTITNNTGAYTIITFPTSPVAPGSAFTDFDIQMAYIGPGTYDETVTLKTSDPNNQIFTFTVTGFQC